MATDSLISERYVLSCILNNPDIIWEIAPAISVKDFGLAANKYIFAVCKKIVEDGQELDEVTIDTNLKGDARKAVEALSPSANALDYVDILKNSPHSMANIQNNVSDIKKASVSRQLIRTFQELIGQLQEEDSDRDVGSLVAYCEDKIVDLGIQNEPIVLTHQVAEGLRPILEERAAAPVEVPGLRTGFARLDSAIGGLRPGQLTVAVARPKVGKTTLLLTWAKNIAIDQGRPVLMLDTEMETSEINTRLVSMLSGIEEKKLLNGLFARDVEEKEAVYRALAVLEEAPLYHIYLPEWDFDTIMAYARKYKVRYGIEALFFDYIKLPDKSNLANAQEYVHLGQLTTDLKNKVAGKLQLPVVTAAQLNRLAVGAASVDTDQVAGSDRILHYCNNLLALTRKSKEDVEKNGFKSNLTLDIIASRNADSGATFDVLFKRPKLQMYEVGAQLGFEDTFNEY